MAPPVPTIVVALIQRRSRLVLVEAQGPDDPTPAWMLPGGQVEPGEPLLEALRRELAEECGLQIIGEPRIVFEVACSAPEGCQACCRVYQSSGSSSRSRTSLTNVGASGSSASSSSRTLRGGRTRSSSMAWSTSVTAWHRASND